MPVPPSPARSPTPGPDQVPRPTTGPVDTAAGTGPSAAPAPSPAASTPRLNLELAPQRAGPLSSQRSMGLLPLLPPPPERKSKLTEGIEKSAKPDCRTAHSDMGLLAVVPLAVDAIRDKGCRW